MIADRLETDELYLDSQEKALIIKKYTAKNQLAFAVILKFFQINLQYPDNESLIPESLIHHLAQQLNLKPTSIEDFNWESRTSERFRSEIRDFLGFKKPTVMEGEHFISWLMTHVLPQAPTQPQCLEKAHRFFRDHRLEPFAPKELDRLIRSAYTRFEKRFFTDICDHLSSETKQAIDHLVDLEADEEESDPVAPDRDFKLRDLKKDIPGKQLKVVEYEIKKLNKARTINIPKKILGTVSRKLALKYYTRILAAIPSHIKEYNTETYYATVAIFCHLRSQILTDNLAELFIELIHRVEKSAEISVTKKITSEVKKVNGKFDILYDLSSTALAYPEGIIQEKIYPKVAQTTLEDLTKELKHQGKWYQYEVHKKMRSLYAHAHRRALLALLNTFTFKTNNPESQDLLKAIEFIKQNQAITDKYYPDTTCVPLDYVMTSQRRFMVIEKQDAVVADQEGPKNTRERVERMHYEMAVLEGLRQKLRYKSIWIEGAYRYRDPDEDLPADFEEKQSDYYTLLDLCENEDEFIEALKNEMHTHLKELNDTLLSNKKVKLVKRGKGKIKISPSAPQEEPKHIKALKRAIKQRWSTLSLLDILKEVDLRIHFTKQFHTLSTREHLDPEKLHKRLLLCLYAIGSNTGLQRISAANVDATHSDLRYVKRRFINTANVKLAIIDVINEILAIRDPRIWGEATTGCASDSTQLSSWDQNLMTEFHVRYRGHGVMIYWHVDRKSACIYSQLKTCSSSEVGAMLKGILHHDSQMTMKQNYVDTHGQSTIGFAFSHLLHFDLLPRLKNINKQTLYYPTSAHKNQYPNLDLILNSSINWHVIKENYNEVVKHAAALKTGTVDPDVLIKKFSKDNYNHPVYKALTEIGKAKKTIFLCRYLMSEELRIEIHEALNVVERLNSVMDFIFYGKLGEISTNKTEEQELSVACLHLLQVCMVYINTLLIQEVLSDPAWENKLTPEDKRALTPLLHAHINPYGLFPLDMSQRLAIERVIKQLQSKAVDIEREDHQIILEEEFVE